MNALRCNDHDAWARTLVERGVQIAHPDDGWVDKERGIVHFVYPQMALCAPAPGVRVALGWPEIWREVEITHEVPHAIGASSWAYKEVSSG